MLYTEDFSMRHYVGFSLIGSHMDKCVCVVHLFYMHRLMPCMFFAFTHAYHMHDTHVPFKLWVICTV